MVQRDVSNYRSVGPQVAEQVTADLSDVATQRQIADAGQQIIAAGQEAKITENFSKAQLELNNLNNQYQIDYEDNPMGGLEKLKEQQKKILDGYGDEISPFFRNQWVKNSIDLGNKNYAQNEAWAFKQTRVNTVKSVNNSIKNNLFQATTDGQNFGNSDETEVGAALNFRISRDKLAAFGDKRIGAATTTEMLESYNEDYMKSFISGVSETNPIKALKMLDDPKIKDSFRDPNQYTKMKEAVEARSLKVGEINAEKQVLSALKEENSLLAKSLETPLSYADLQKEFDRTGMSPGAQAFFMKANGYTKADGTRNVSDSDKIKGKAQLYTELTDLTSKENLSSAEISAFQEKIYSAMNNGTLDNKEGVSYLNQIISPLVDQKEQTFKNFSDNSLIAPDIGFKGVQKMFESEIEIKPAGDEKEVGELTKATNNANKVKLYDYYMTALTANAESYGAKVADIPKMDKVQQRKLYSESQAEAKRLYMLDQHPALSTMNDIPNQIFAGGKLIQGMAGDRAVKPDIAVPNPFQMQVGSDGYLYRMYSDGMRERAGKAPSGLTLPDAPIQGISAPITPVDRQSLPEGKIKDGDIGKSSSVPDIRAGDLTDDDRSAMPPSDLSPPARAREIIKQSVPEKSENRKKITDEIKPVIERLINKGVDQEDILREIHKYYEGIGKQYKYKDAEDGKGAYKTGEVRFASAQELKEILRKLKPTIMANK